jgi:hypothetical protein
MAIAEYAKANGGHGAIATTSGPLAGMTWQQIAQGIINVYAANQSTGGHGYPADRDGGWRYYIGDTGYGDSDMSTTQWAVLASIYGESLGATTPQTVKDHLKTWLAAVQDPITGVACYQPSTAPCEQADTGGLLLSLNFVGAQQTDPAVVAALKFLNNNWANGPAGWDGNFGQPYAMWADYKALELTIGKADTSTINNLLDVTCGGNSPTTCNWWQDYKEWLVKNQNGDGSWPGYFYWVSPLTAAYYLPILGGASIPVQPPSGVPEPATLGLFAAALVALARTRRGKLPKQ